MKNTTPHTAPPRPEQALIPSDAAGDASMLLLDEGSGVTLLLPLEPEALRAPVVEMSKGSLRVRIEQAHLGQLKPEMTLRGCVLTPSAHPPQEIPELTVTELRVGERWELTVTLEAAEDASRARLWQALERLSMGAACKSMEMDALVRLPRVPDRGIYTEEARLKRLGFLRQHSDHHMGTLQDTSLNASQLTGNIENLIGGVEIPIGLAGPLLFRGDKARGAIYAPFATTEGALVASACRGARAISGCGGVTTRVVQQRMMRVPLFVLSNMRGAFLFSSWIRDHVAEIRAEVGKVSRHAQLISVEPTVLGNQVHVTFLYETGDAAGQNMTTSCTWHCCQWLMAQMRHYDDIAFEHFIIEANMSGDKKVTFQSLIQGRGTRVTAECFLTAEQLERVLKVTPEQLLRTSQGFMAGSAQVGMVGFNINVANVIAAIFTATGQDIACVHESSLALLNIQPVQDGLYASVTLPALIVGTVGGGTALPRQRELLESMDCYGPGKVSRFAEIIAGYCLALDLSTLSAIASGQFATAHERLGRNRPVAWFQSADLSPTFFQAGMREHLDDPALVVHDVAPLERTERGSSIITELTARKVSKLVGHIPYRVDSTDHAGERSSREVMVKVKPLDDEVVLMINSMASMCAPRLAAAYGRFRRQTGFAGVHTRELGVYAQRDPRFRRHTPTVYHLHRDDRREAYVLVLERLKDMVLMDTADDPSGWTMRHIQAVIVGLAELHAIWYGREEELREQPWLGFHHTTATMSSMMELWEALGVHAAEEFPEWVSRHELVLHRELVQFVPEMWAEIEAMPRTLIHNDFNPRNVCLRPSEGDQLTLCAYDWELATLHLPQRDLAEFLCFTLPRDVEQSTVDGLIEAHRRALEEAAQVTIDRPQCERGFVLSLYDLTINRMALYAMAHTFRHYAFMERVWHTARHLIRLYAGK